MAYKTLNELFSAIAVAIRGKTGSSAKITAQDFPAKIASIVTGITPSGTKSITTNGTHNVNNYQYASVNVPTTGTDTTISSSYAASETDIRSGKRAYANGELIVGAMPTTSIDSIDSDDFTVSSAGKVSVTARISSAGYAATGSKTGSHQLDVQAAKSYTPGTSDQTINKGVYLTGNQTIKGDSNLVAANIAKGKSIFGVTGTFTGNDPSTGTHTETGDDIEELVIPNITTMPKMFHLASDRSVAENDTDVENVTYMTIGGVAYVDTVLCTSVVLSSSSEMSIHERYFRQHSSSPVILSMTTNGLKLTAEPGKYFRGTYRYVWY